MGSVDGIKDSDVCDNNGAVLKGKKRTIKEKCKEMVPSRKIPRRAAACSDFKEKAVRLNEKEFVIETKRDHVVEDEVAAIALTSGHDIPRPNRRLTDFIFHDEEGRPQPVEMLEVCDLYITGVVLPLEPSSEKIKEKGVRCEGFGRIETWSISGYEDGSPVIWASTEMADYDCGKPSASYRNIYGMFYEKARACVEVYKQVSRASGGNPDISLDELVARVVRSMDDSKIFPQGASSIKEFLIAQGCFIYNQLVGLDDTSEKHEHRFVELPVLNALREECERAMAFDPGYTASANMGSSGTLKIGVERKGLTNSSVSVEEDEDVKLARLLQEEEHWQSMKKKNKNRAPSSNRFYIKINEDEIADDYPMPSYYKPSDEETDEYIIFDSSMDIFHPDELPKTMLHNWSLYNSDARLISLELLPMKPCADIDVTIFGSGVMTDDDGSGYSLDASQSSSASAGLTGADGIPIYLSAIKEWMIEFGASMIFISIRTDMAWYRLGKPSEQYSRWYDTVIKTARLGICIIMMLKQQSRVARLSFSDIIKKLSEFDEKDPNFISSNPTAVERYVVVHGQIILQQFALYPDDAIRKSAFGSGLQEKMESRHHTKWLVKKKSVISKGVNLNPRASMKPVTKRSMMPATTTRLINRIWGEFYSNYAPENLKEGASDEPKEEIEVEDEAEEIEDAEEEIVDKVSDQKTDNLLSKSAQKRLRCSNHGIKWDGEPAGKTCGNETLYQQAYIRGELVSVGGSVIIETLDSEEFPLYFVEYMFETLDGKKMVHGRLMVRGSETILGIAASEREVFLTKDCLEFELGAVKQIVKVDIRLIPWGFQHRKANAEAEKADKENAEERKKKGMSLEYYCKFLYSPERGAFLRLPSETMGTGSGICYSCKMKESQGEKDMFKLNTSRDGFTYKGTDYKVDDFVYIPSNLVATDEREKGTFKSGRNVGLKPYAVCQLVEIVPPSTSKKLNPESVKAKVRRFFRPEDISEERAYRSDIREVYYSEQVLTVTLASIQGKCEVRKKHYIQSLKSPAMYEHTFFCEHLYDPKSGAIKQLPSNIKLCCLQEKMADDLLKRKKKGKGIEGETDDIVGKKEASQTNQLATLDIFAGCGGLSEGLQQSGVSLTKWAIEYEEPAGEAFNLNHTQATMFINNCNVILKAIMSACGDESDCISTPEAAELAGKLDEKVINSLPKPGQVDFINGGPPCQGFSGMNRFNQGIWSKVQCEMILAFLSFADYFRPRYFLLENVRNFVSFNKGQTFRLAVASLLEMGYQVRYGILEAGAYGVSQSRKRAFIWAASPEEILPEWPEPMHVFASPELRITLDNNVQYAAVRSTSTGAPFRSITVRDTIADLPAVENGASKDTMEYKIEPVSWFQKMIRGDMVTLTDHITKEMNELNLIRCQKIPKRPGADWRDLPEEKFRLSTGQMVDLIPWCLPNTADRHNQWKGLFGRLDWEGNFPTSITDPQPMGKVGMCFHPDQDRIVTVRECARTQGFPDGYKFFGNIQNRYRQIGNAVPPPLAFALGRKLKEAIEEKTRNPTGLRDSPYL